MSAPDPMKWDVTTAESEDLRDGTFRTQEKIVNAVARRRAIEELKAMADSAIEEPNRLPICPVFTVRLEDIRYRIAAIEAEEA